VYVSVGMCTFVLVKQVNLSPRIGMGVKVLHGMCQRGSRYSVYLLY
jgi:hypothetical protein